MLNVRSIYQVTKAANIIKENGYLLYKYILGCSELRWPNYGQCKIDGCAVYNVGEDSTQHINSIGIIVSEEISSTVLIFKINFFSYKLNIIQVYGPILAISEEEIESFCNNIKMALIHT